MQDDEKQLPAKIGALQILLVTTANNYFRQVLIEQKKTLLPAEPLNQKTEQIELKEKHDRKTFVTRVKTQYFEAS